ncbi:hypothetical protein DP115_32375, partial [Brasilonema octagenarum UFV-OR1]|nr:hypothetical protein [Brasilonema octagenarum UFV-OR1]
VRAETLIKHWSHQIKPDSYSKHVTKFTHLMNKFYRLIETSFLLVIHLSNWFNKTALKVYLNFKNKKSKFRYERAKVLLRCKC